ncbi:hypothetical protein ABIF65_008201 [Bradyrhizobium japonicum]
MTAKNPAGKKIAAIHGIQAQTADPVDSVKLLFWADKDDRSAAFALRTSSEVATGPLRVKDRLDMMSPGRSPQGPVSNEDAVSCLSYSAPTLA